MYSYSAIKPPMTLGSTIGRCVNMLDPRNWHPSTIRIQLLGDSRSGVNDDVAQIDHTEGSASQAISLVLADHTPLQPLDSRLLLGLALANYASEPLFSMPVRVRTAELPDSSPFVYIDPLLIEDDD